MKHEIEIASTPKPHDPESRVRRTNARVIFAPTGMILRGRWSPAQAARFQLGEALRALSDVGDIPGMRILVDETKSGVNATIYDPLAGTTEGKAVWERMKPILDQHSASMGLTKPAGTVTQKLDADKAKTWLHAMVRLVETGKAVVTSASSALPSLDDIAQRPGRRVADPMSSGRRDEKDKYTDIVPERAIA